MPIAYDNKVTLGNMLTIGTFVFGLAAGYENINARQNNSEERLSLVESNLKESTMETNARERELEGRLRLIEVAQASQSSDLRNIQVGINELKTSLDQLATRIARP